MSISVMENKKRSSVKDREATPSKVVKFLVEIKQELKKVTWTSREELLVYTKIVVGATFVLGLGIFLFDIVIQNLLGSLEALTRLIIG